MLKIAKELEIFEAMIIEERAMEEFRAYCQMATESLEKVLARTLQYQRKELIAATSEIRRWIREAAKTTKHFAILGI